MQFTLGVLNNQAGQLRVAALSHKVTELRKATCITSLQEVRSKQN